MQGYAIYNVSDVYITVPFDNTAKLLALMVTLIVIIIPESDGASDVSFLNGGCVDGDFKCGSQGLFPIDVKRFPSRTTLYRKSVRWLMGMS